MPLVVLAGKEYGSGSSRDWAAKGTALLGVRAVIAESYERIHRSNLIGMGVLPLQFLDGESADLARPHRREDDHRSGPGRAPTRCPGSSRWRPTTARSRPGSASTPRPRSPTTATAACCSTCSASSSPPAEPPGSRQQPRRAPEPAPPTAPPTRPVDAAGPVSPPPGEPGGPLYSPRDGVCRTRPGGQRWPRRTPSRGVAARATSGGSRPARGAWRACPRAPPAVSLHPKDPRAGRPGVASWPSSSASRC